MTVQDIFKKADNEVVFNAYGLIEPFFGDLDTHTIQEKAQKLKKLRKIIEDNCKKIKDYDIDEDGDPHTIFILEEKSSEWGESSKKTIDAFCIRDEEAFEVIAKKFTIWDEEGAYRLNHYGFDLIPFCEVAGYNVAAESVRKLGVDVCCATILRRMFYWGFTDEDREERIKEFKNKLDKSFGQIERGETVYANIIDDDEIEKDLRSKMTPDELVHDIFSEEYEDKVKEIEDRYCAKIMNENHKKYIETIRREYENRNSVDGMNDI
ncbi:DUF6557 family protein [Butyrivibrio sp. AD3002]|uniref:DUF6557 family protein n=1 Tax=Butyrivibrio sp. AD3002 TaxID=1280670 RepID=UPI0003B5BE7E|nr:DUF6557 family protein [Butyrivibrio sp. AD3002]